MHSSLSRQLIVISRHNSVTDARRKQVKAIFAAISLQLDERNVEFTEFEKGSLVFISFARLAFRCAAHIAFGAAAVT